MAIPSSRRFCLEALGLEGLLLPTHLEHYVIVKEVEASHQPNSQGAADAGVQAEEDHAKKGRGSYSRASRNSRAG